MANVSAGWRFLLHNVHQLAQNRPTRARPYSAQYRSLFVGTLIAKVPDVPQFAAVIRTRCGFLKCGPIFEKAPVLVHGTSTKIRRPSKRQIEEARSALINAKAVTPKLRIWRNQRAGIWRVGTRRRYWSKWTVGQALQQPSASRALKEFARQRNLSRPLTSLRPYRNALRPLN